MRQKKKKGWEKAFLFLNFAFSIQVVERFAIKVGRTLRLS